MAGNNDGKVYLTREKLTELEHELREMKTNGRADIAAKIAEARGYGDLSENAEYDAAKEAQQHLEIADRQVGRNTFTCADHRYCLFTNG